MRFSTLLWDMDGTLFDTYPAIRQAIIDIFATHGVTLDPIEVARLLASTFDDCVTILSARHHLDADVIRTQYHAHPGPFNPGEQPPFPGVVDLCQRVIAAGGANLIFTHRGRKSLDDFLALYAMNALFADTLTADEGFPRKPDPTAFLAILARNGIAAKDTLAIGDRDLDIQAGNAAGMQTCFFSPPTFPGGAPLPEATPDYTIATYAELEILLFAG
jgi:phosphoglycolate phosphatase-like HAD superfamily hydrolase